MAVEKLFVNARFHFALFFFGVASRVTGGIFAIGIDAGNERNCFSVRRPQLIVRAGGKGGEPVRFAALEVHPVDLRIVFDAARKKCELFAIGRPARAGIGAAARQLPRLASSRGHDPDIAHTPVGIEVGRGHGVSDPFTVGRNLRIAQAMHCDQVLKRDGALALFLGFQRNRRCASYSRNDYPHGHGLADRSRAHIHFSSRVVSRRISGNSVSFQQSDRIRHQNANSQHSPIRRPSGLPCAKKNQRAAREQQEHAENFWKFDNSRSFHDHFLATDLKFPLLGRHAEIGMNQSCDAAPDQQDP